MTDYYVKIREHLESSPHVALSDYKFMPKEMSNSLVALFRSTQDYQVRYHTNNFTEQHWDEIKQVCALYDSPLWKALE